VREKMKKITNLFVRFIVITLVATLLLTFISCSLPDASELHNQQQAAHMHESDGTHEDDSIVTPSNIFEPEYVEQIVNPDRSLFYGETITIATWNPHFLNGVAVRYMEANPGVTINIINHRDSSWIFADGFDFSEPRLEIATQLMAGSAPTLIAAELADPFDMRQAVYFYDWYLLMDADPNFNEDEWFMNVFHGFSKNDRLFHFPIFSNYNVITANTTISDLQDTIDEKPDGATIMDLVEIHRDFSVDYPEFYLEEYFATEMILEYEIGRFVDIETGRVDFGEEFIDLITYAKSTTCPDYSHRWRNLSHNAMTDLRKSTRYLFHFRNTMYYHHFVDYEGERPFVGMTPLVNDYGELLLDSRLSVSYLLNANATPIEKAIAWDFIMFLMEYENQIDTDLQAVLLLSPNRNTFENNARSLLPGRIRMVTWFRGSDDDAIDAIDGIVETMFEFHEMPMRVTRVLPNTINEVIENAIQQFHDGLLSAEQTAELLQNQITLVLMEMER